MSWCHVGLRRSLLLPVWDESSARDGCRDETVKDIVPCTSAARSKVVAHSSQSQQRRIPYAFEGVYEVSRLRKDEGLRPMLAPGPG